MSFPDESDVLDLARRYGLEDSPHVRQRLPAIRLVKRAGEGRLGASKLGGLPDLPPHVGWPRWDATSHLEEELADARSNAGRILMPFWKGEIRRREEELAHPETPLGFLAQIDLADLRGLPHGLPLPEQGHLLFFYALDRQPWGYSPCQAGAWRVVFVAAGEELAPRCAPPDLQEELLLQGSLVTPAVAWTVPDEVEGETDWSEDQERFFEELAKLNPGAQHQIGGHPELVQGDMRPLCSLVTKGVYMGSDPGLSDEEYARLTADAGEWRLLLQLASDDDLDWMWGDCGNLYWWMRESDIQHGAWDRAWFQLQCS